LGIAINVALKILAPQVFLPGFTQLNALLLLIGGFLFLALGVLGEYVGRIYEEVKGRPLYLVFQTCGIEPCRDESTASPAASA
jgi:hypothetical protein